MRGKKFAALSLSGPVWDMAAVTLFSILLFFAMNIWMEPAAVWIAFIALVLILGRVPWRLAHERFCVPVIAFLCFLITTGLAAIYSPFGGSAVRDFRSILPAFALAVLALLRFERRHVRGLLWGIAVVCAAVSLLSTDMVCEGPLYDAFISLMDCFGMGTVYTDEVENTVGRVNGIYNDANVTGSLFAIAALISLYLAQTGKKWWARLLACVLISINALGLLLSVSRGAILCFAASLLVWLLVAGKEQRLRLFLLMVVAAGSCVVAFMPLSSAVVPGAFIPNVLTVGPGVVIFLLDWAVAERLARKLAGHGKAVLAVIGVFVVVLGVGIGVSLSVTGDYVFQGEGYLQRSARLDPGAYTVHFDGDIGARTAIQIYKVSQEESLQGTFTSLYAGLLEDQIDIIVPEDTVRVFFRFHGWDGDTLQAVTLSNGTEIPLGYKYLPEAIASRLHRGIFSDNSYLLRVQFMKDAWSIFKQSPLAGHGLGSSDNLYPMVQPFYYQSRYVHNHVLQVMADQGLLGVIPFIIFLGGVLWLLIRQIRKDWDPLASVLLACWVMMNSHSLMEINFSIQSYQCVAFTLLLLPVMLYGEPLKKLSLKMSGAVLCILFWLYLAIFGGLMELRQRVQKESANLRAASMDQLMDALDSYARRDVFDPDPYRLEYVATAVQDTEGNYSEKMLRYVEKIRRSENYPACSGLPQYYYLPIGDFEGLFECSRQILIQRTSYEKVWNGEVEFYRDKVLPAIGADQVDIFIDGVSAFQALLCELNQGRIEEIILDADNQAFLDLINDVSSQSLSKEELYHRLMNSGEEPAIAQ